MREERERTQEIGSFPNGSYEEVLAPPEAAAAAAAAEAAAVVVQKQTLLSASIPAKVTQERTRFCRY